MLVASSRRATLLSGSAARIACAAVRSNQASCRAAGAPAARVRHICGEGRRIAVHAVEAGRRGVHAAACSAQPTHGPWRCLLSCMHAHASNSTTQHALVVMPRLTGPAPPPCNPTAGGQAVGGSQDRPQKVTPPMEVCGRHAQGGRGELGLCLQARWPWRWAGGMPLQGWGVEWGLRSRLQDDGHGWGASNQACQPVQAMLLPLWELQPSCQQPAARQASWWPLIPPPPHHLNTHKQSPVGGGSMHSWPDAPTCLWLHAGGGEAAAAQCSGICSCGAAGRPRPARHPAAGGCAYLCVVGRAALAGPVYTSNSSSAAPVFPPFFCILQRLAW